MLFKSKVVVLLFLSIILSMNINIASAGDPPLSGKIIIVDPGHGLSMNKDGSFHFSRSYWEVVTEDGIEKIYNRGDLESPDSTTKDINNALVEDKVVVKIGIILKKYLEQNGAIVYSTRDLNIDDSLKGVSDYPRWEEGADIYLNSVILNDDFGDWIKKNYGSYSYIYSPMKSKLDIKPDPYPHYRSLNIRWLYANYLKYKNPDKEIYYVSIHTNGNNRTNPKNVDPITNNAIGHGTETYYSKYAVDYSKKLAESVQEAVIERVRNDIDPSWYDRKSKSNSLSVLDNNKNPAALIEVAFHDNIIDNKWLLNDNFLKTSARGILEGLNGKNGLHASYYNNPIYLNNVNVKATPDVERIEPDIDFVWRNWENDFLPDGIKKDDAWSVDWTGFIYAPTDGTYKFDLYSDDGSWLFIDNTMVIDNDGGDHPPRHGYGSIFLTKGYHSILVKYYECCWGDANINLSWMLPDTTNWGIVSSKDLFISPPETMPANLIVRKTGPLYQELNSWIIYTISFYNRGESQLKNVIIKDKLKLPEDCDAIISIEPFGICDKDTNIITWEEGPIKPFGGGSIRLILLNKAPLGSTVPNIVDGTTDTNEDKSDNHAEVNYRVILGVNLPPGVDIEALHESSTPNGVKTVNWEDEIKFTYDAKQDATIQSVDIRILLGDNVIKSGVMENPYKDRIFEFKWPISRSVHGMVTVEYIIHRIGSDQTISYPILIDPSGYVYDVNNEKRIENATVTLFRLNSNSGSFEIIDPSDIGIDPHLNPQITDVYGGYGWNVSAGIYYVHVEKDGYFPADSFEVVIPPAITDLNIGLTPQDSTPPTTNLTFSGTFGNNGWYVSDVQVNLTATDNGGSGINSTKYSFDETNWITYTAPFNITTEGTTTLYYYSTDNAGNVEITKNQTIKIDKTPPQITIDTPARGSSYILNQTVPANWSANDSISGIDSVTATTPNGNAIDTATVGNKTFSINATDNSGNQANKTVTYSVVYNYSGILPPINANGNSIFKLGSTIPVKFQLQDANEKYISTAIGRIYVTNITKGATGKEINGTSTSGATIGNLFRYDSTSNQYIFNLATKPLSVGTWRIRIYIDDGTSKYATIGLK